MAATTQVSKWGNSLGVRLPKSVAREAQLDGYSLDELVCRITPRNRHDESDWGGPLGDEVW
jgi:antitoxin MazE